MTGSPASDFRAWIDTAEFPCVGAKSALAHGDMDVMTASDIRSDASDTEVHAALLLQTQCYIDRQQPFQSLAVLFPGTPPLSEKEFETSLWARLQSVTDIDHNQGYAHDRQVSADPQDPFFAVSFGGAGFFVVGLHPAASRPGRRFDCAAIVFNIHEQFEQLRREGLYDRLNAAIGLRDMDIAGSRNPMLGQHGEISAARQYSGRAVESGWTCPFHRSELPIEDTP